LTSPSLFHPPPLQDTRLVPVLPISATDSLTRLLQALSQLHKLLRRHHLGRHLTATRTPVSTASALSAAAAIKLTPLENAIQRLPCHLLQPSSATTCPIPRMTSTTTRRAKRVSRSASGFQALAKPRSTATQTRAESADPRPTLPISPRPSQPSNQPRRSCKTAPAKLKLSRPTSPTATAIPSATRKE
jgi:hypothetical protein